MLPSGSAPIAMWEPSIPCGGCAALRGFFFLCFLCLPCGLALFLPCFFAFFFAQLLACRLCFFFLAFAAWVRWPFLRWPLRAFFAGQRFCFFMAAVAGSSYHGISASSQ